MKDTETKTLRTQVKRLPKRGAYDRETIYSILDEAFTEHVIPGRWPEIRWPNELELKATSVLKLPIEEASAKIRTGDPKDDEEDYAMKIWAGVLPLAMAKGDPVPDSRLPEGVEVPDHVRDYRR